MPLKKCSINGKSGWKWGDAGKCYTGPDAKKKAMAQAVAIEASQAREGKSSEFKVKPKKKGKK